MAFLAGIIAVILALAHVTAWRLRFLNVVPRSRWLSAAGGIAVAYVFVHLLPELHRGQETLERSSAQTVFRFFEAHAYLVALLGLGIFYGLELLARGAKPPSNVMEDNDSLATSPGVFWLHMGSFAVYNVLIGYLLLHREVKGSTSLIFYGVAMGTHFVVNDFGLNRHHRARYRHVGRWILSAAILLGWGVGLLLTVHEAVVAVLFAFLAGGVIMNVLKEELPETQRSRFWPFALGAVAYAALLIVVV